MVQQLLSENPIDPQVKWYCGIVAGDLLADASIWPDDVCKQLNHGPWHYIDFPSGAPLGPLNQYSGEDGCVTTAIATQWTILKDASAVPAKGAETVRHLTHLVGDLHMPLHVSTNNDLAGNCVPVRYVWRVPQLANNSYIPNLHSLWDSTLV